MLFYSNAMKTGSLKHCLDIYCNLYPDIFYIYVFILICTFIRVKNIKKLSNLNSVCGVKSQYRSRQYFPDNLLLTYIFVFVLNIHTIYIYQSYFDNYLMLVSTSSTHLSLLFAKRKISFFYHINHQHGTVFNICTIKPVTP